MPSEFRQHILELGMIPVIPPRPNSVKAPADYDRHLYRERHLVECFIGKIKHYRRIFSRVARSWTPDTWASCISPPLSSGYGENVNRILASRTAFQRASCRASVPDVSEVRYGCYRRRPLGWDQAVNFRDH